MSCYFGLMHNIALEAQVQQQTEQKKFFDRTSYSIISLILLALIFSFVGSNKASLTPVEICFLEQTQSARQRGLQEESLRLSLEEVCRYVDFFLSEEYEDMAVEQGEESLLRMAQLEATEIKKSIEERASVLRRQGRGKILHHNGLIFIKESIQKESFSRGIGWYIFAFVFAFFAALMAILRALNLRRRTRDRLIQICFFVTALSSVLILFFIMIFLFKEGLPLFKEVSVSEFIFGRGWYPTDEDDPEFGIFPLIMGSLSVTALSSLIAIPLGVMTALYLAEIATHKVRSIVKPIIELLASLPSVVIGFFGMVIVAPFLQDVFGIANGLNMLNASVMLAFMSVPTITSVSEDAIFSVPLELKEASLALGATHSETIWKVIVPASLSGISTAIILGMSRAIGETMVVLMVAGGAGLVPSSIFDPVRPMPASIAAEMGEAPFGEAHYFALFAIGIVLFLFTLVFNLIADHIAHKYKQVGAATL